MATAAKKKAAPPKRAGKKAVEPFTPDAASSSADAVDEQLARYRSMRDFNVTAEPSGKANDPRPSLLPFCIQKHAASHLHYDFRLGWNGVLKSWASAKGPSYVVGDRHLAVQVEDHPIEYGGFEGIIPKGQYGGGTVMLWDQGTWEPQPGHTDVDAGLRDGSLKFILHGTKMHGKWALIRMGGKAAREAKPNWLLIKEHDDFERTAAEPSVTEAENKSVITGRTMEQIAASEDHVWNSKETAKGNAWIRQEPKSAPTPAALPGLEELPKEHQPSFLKPQLAQETEAPPEGSGWLHELKLDGYRMQARKDGAKVQMLTRSGLDWTERVRSVAVEVARLPVENITLDGEVVVVAADGTTNFADLQASFQEGARNPLTYFCFDLLHLAGRNPRGLSLLERKKLLAQAIQTAEPTLLQLSEHLETDGLAMFHKACELHAEGIVSKKRDAPYREGRSADWVKSKCLHEQEFVVAGYTLPSNGGPGVGALLLGYYDDAGKLIYAGRTGTGFTHKFSAELRRRLQPMETAKTALARASAEAKRGAIWVRPELVAQVRFATWTADDQLRQAAFLGLREDKPATEVRREAADAAPRPKQNAGKALPGKAPAKHVPIKLLPAGPLEKAPVRLTHPDKVLDHETALTKQQLADFYWAVAERMLPHIANRPLSLVRCPDGSERPCFYQKHVNNMLPKSVNTVMVADKKTGTPEPYITLNTRDALAGLAQMGVLEIHPWGSTNEDLERPNQLTIDLDPDESLPWETLTGAALDVRGQLKQLGLESWVKTTGGKGLHVVIPIEPRLAWPEIKQWCHGFVDRMARSNPKLYLTVMTKAARTGRIYLDYLRNERGATAVAPYSPRARKGMGVAVPLLWTELTAPERPNFRAANFSEWGGRLKKDVWAGLLECRQRLP